MNRFLLAMATAMVASAAQPQQIRYDCQTGEFLLIRFQPGGKNGAGGRAILEVTGKPRLILPQVISGSGVRYSDGYTVLWNKGNEVFLESGDFYPRECKERPAAPAGGTDNSLLGRWRLIQIGGRPVTLERPAYIEFQMEGKAAGSLGCNRFSGPYQIAGSQLKMGPPISTKMACFGPGMDIEMQFSQALAAAASWRVTGNELTLLDTSGKTLGTWIRSN